MKEGMGCWASNSIVAPFCGHQFLTFLLLCHQLSQATCKHFGLFIGRGNIVSAVPAGDLFVTRGTHIGLECIQYKRINCQ